MEPVKLSRKAVAYLELEAYGGEKDAAAAWAAGVLDVGEWPAAATLAAPMLRNAEAAAPVGTGGDLTKPDIYTPAGAALEGAAGDDDDPWADGEGEPRETLATPLPTRSLTCPEARALTDAAYAVDWADELAELTADELEAHSERMAGCGPMGQAAILEARYRLAKASHSGLR